MYKVKTACKKSGISFYIEDCISTGETLLVDTYPRLNNRRQFQRLVTEHKLTIPKTLLAGYIIITMQDLGLCASSNTYTERAWPRLNESLTGQSRDVLLKQLATVEHSRLHPYACPAINISTILSYQSPKLIARQFDTALKILSGQVLDELSIEEQEKLIKTNKVFIAPIIKITHNIPKPKAKPARASKMDLASVLKRIPKIYTLILESDNIDTEALPTKATASKVFKLLPNYAGLSQTTLDTMESVLETLIILGIGHGVFTVDSIEYKSLKHIVRQLSKADPIHAEAAILF